MIDDVVLFFLFFENRETAPHHQKKGEKVFSDTTARKNIFCKCKKISFMSVYVPKSCVCKFLLKKFGESQLQLPHHENSSQPLYRNIFTAINMGSKKHKDSTAMKALVIQAHEERSDVNVDGSIAGGAPIFDAATIKGANAAGNSTIEVDVVNITDRAAAGNAVAATGRHWRCHRNHHDCRWQRCCSHRATGDTTDNAHTTDAPAIKGANAAVNSTITVNIANTADAAATGNSTTANAAAAGDGVKVTTDMITTEITEAAMRVIMTPGGKTSAEDTDVNLLIRVSIHISRALLYILALFFPHYNIILYLNNFTHISL